MDGRPGPDRPARTALRHAEPGRSRPGRTPTRTPWSGPPDPAPPPAPGAERQVGGRAMLDPDESLTGQLARLRGPAEPEHDPNASGRPTPRPRAAGWTWPRAARAPAGAGRPRPARSWWSGHGCWGRPPATGSAGPSARPPTSHAPAWSWGPGWSPSCSSPPSRPSPRGARATNPRPSRPPRRRRPPSNPPAPPGNRSSTRRSTRDGVIAVNVPAGWEQSGNGSYVDYTDPASARKIRINIENAGSTPQRFLEVAENGLNTRPASCAAPYQRSRPDRDFSGRAFRPPSSSTRAGTPTPSGTACGGPWSATGRRTTST